MVDEAVERPRPVVVGDLAGAGAAMILAHGRDRDAGSILRLARRWAVDGLVLVAPEAAERSWYPGRFQQPYEENEPKLSRSFAAVDEALAVVSMGGVPPDRTILLGFSQGACLLLEYAARNARRYGALIGLSGALMGPPGEPRRDSGWLAGTPVFLGCGDQDEFIPAERVRFSARALTELGGTVTHRIYPGLGHVVNDDETATVSELVGRLLPLSGAA